MVTQQVGQQRALAYWVDTVCDQFLELEIDTPGPQPLPRLAGPGGPGPGDRQLFEADNPTRTAHERQDCPHARPMFVLMQLRVGESGFAVGLRCAHRSGECVFVDGTEPYELECLSLTKAVALRLPADWLSGWLAQPQHHAGKVFSSHGWSSALCAFVAGLI